MGRFGAIRGVFGAPGGSTGGHGPRSTPTLQTPPVGFLPPWPTVRKRPSPAKHVSLSGGSRTYGKVIASVQMDTELSEASNHVVTEGLTEARVRPIPQFWNGPSRGGLSGPFPPGGMAATTWRCPASPMSETEPSSCASRPILGVRSGYSASATSLSIVPICREGDAENRTRINGFAGRCVTTPTRRRGGRG